METTILENDTTPTESNVVKEEAVETPEKVSTVETPESPEQPAKEEPQKEEPTFEVDGEKYTASQIKKLKEDFDNDSKWKDKNRRESEELNRKRQELQPLELIRPFLEQRPELLQEFFKPKQSRDFDKELQAHYDSRAALPRDDAGNFDYRAFSEWELKRDRLNADRASNMSQEAARKELQQAEVRSYSESLEARWHKEFVVSGKLSEQEFVDSIRWVVDNVNAKGGKIPENAMAMAYKTIHEDKYLREVKLDATKRAIAPIMKAKSSITGDGKNQTDAERTDENEDDSSFVNVVRARTKNYQRLP